jgi:hypothetical protein
MVEQVPRRLRRSAKGRSEVAPTRHNLNAEVLREAQWR